ncbi:MAG: AAA family ATPase [Aquisalimonadaceae bacterium]
MLSPVHPFAVEASTQLHPVRAVGLHEFLALNLPPREAILDPWLPGQGLSMLYAPRGVGKTHLSLGIAYAVASGGSFLGWNAPKAQEVLFIDGEMPASSLQERLSQIILSDANPPDDVPLRLITPDLQELGMPDLASEAGQAAINSQVTPQTKLVVVDNLSTLVRSGKENEGESWQPVQAWALRQRAQGRSVLFIHHAGKGGAQRGTSRREDVLDTVIALKQPSDYSPEHGAMFEVHFEKARGVFGDAVAPFTARLIAEEDGTQTWSRQTLEESNYEKVITFANVDLKPIDIASELGLNKSTVSRHLKRARAEGRLKGPDT